ncbi:recombinase family protein [Ralstonia pseudosolanacearum]|uniref:Recombinase family protein n=2 Tax=Ralstonia solanacearum species complex TaxID=3116862 RepID=A0AA92QAH6_RALSL|nr:recombinase family protein [Ralstonia pseudosolanacearum]QOK91033.1 recombinase family protein [Ralstonia pseudosolanacearum]QOK95942.1 recombinase family protein [Ralstonia pseudosolanacearum]UWD91987.1 recombinase family protein [Ralstonia pseudosolanacearum]CAH0440324.1 DNA-invertase hin [Ralstonia pseudosolanacearum]
MLYGYARVSTQEQETHAQTDALSKAGVGFIFSEKRSGGSTVGRPELEKLLRVLKPGDQVIVYKLDRIARSLKDLLRIIERIEEKGAQFRSLTESLDTTTPAGRMLFHMVGAFAEFERELIRERTRAGMAAAAKRGVKLGRHYAMSREDEAEALRLWHSGQMTKTAIARMFGVHMSSVKRAIKRHQER